MRTARHRGRIASLRRHQVVQYHLPQAEDPLRVRIRRQHLSQRLRAASQKLRVRNIYLLHYSKSAGSSSQLLALRLLCLCPRQSISCWMASIHCCCCCLNRFYGE